MDSEIVPRSYYKSGILNDLIQGVSQNPLGPSQLTPYQLFYLPLHKTWPSSPVEEEGKGGDEGEGEERRTGGEG